MSVVVTGAQGYIGGAIARALVAEGRRVLCLGMQDPQIPGTRFEHWDIETEMSAADRHRLRLNDAVVHAERISDDWTDEQTLHARNVTGTRNVLDAFPGARIVCLSSTAVYDPGSIHRDLYEEGGPVEAHRYLCAYERVSAAAEQVIARVRPDAAVLRPHGIYGPGDTTLWPIIERSIDDGALRLPGGGKQSSTLTHIDTLTAAVSAAIERPEATGPINVGDPQPYELREALNTYLGRFGHPSVTFDAMPADLALITAWLKERRARRKKRRPPFTRHVVRQLVRERTYNLSRMHRLLGVAGVQGLKPARGAGAARA